jgi:hypothetical protein
MQPCEHTYCYIVVLLKLVSLFEHIPIILSKDERWGAHFSTPFIVDHNTYYSSFFEVYIWSDIHLWDY